jgi:hypothetical protein
MGAALVKKSASNCLGCSIAWRPQGFLKCLCLRGLVHGFNQNLLVHVTTLKPRLTGCANSSMFQ